AALQQTVSGACPPPLAQRLVSLSQVPPGHEFCATVPQPPGPVQGAPAVDPPTHRIGMRSPVRKSCELSGTLSLLVLPALQSPMPDAPGDRTLMTHHPLGAPSLLGAG